MLTLAGWLSRHAWRALVSLVVIILVLIAGSAAIPWVQAQREEARTLSTQRDTLAEARAQLTDLQARVPSPADLARLGDQALADRRAAVARQRQAARAQRLTDGQLLAAAASGATDRIVAHGRAEVTLAALEAEDAALARIQAQRGVGQARQVAQAADARARALAAEVGRLNAGPLSAERNAVCRRIGTAALGCAPVARLDRVEAELATQRATRDRALAALATRRRAVEAAAAAEARLASVEQAAERARADLLAREGALGSQARDNWWEWVKRPVLDVLPQALLILLGVLLAPPAIKAVLYFIVAPAAARRPPIRLLPGAGGVEGAGHVSAVTLALPLTPGAELLVRPDFLQSSPDSATKRTRWLFDWGMPLTSLAAGLVGLTAVRGSDGRTVAVSAKDDPLAEVGRVDLPAGGAFVLQPRALIGLVQRADQPMRLTRHWRLGLTAWLTLQLRYLVIHGPGVAIVQGTRGVRLEEAGAGRVSDQAGTLGFDAALAYSVTRSETFGAYLMGKAGLFDDRFRGDGRYLYEEMPRGRDGGSVWGRGLEGLSDAVLKVFGV